MSSGTPAKHENVAKCTRRAGIDQVSLHVFEASGDVSGSRAVLWHAACEVARRVAQPRVVDILAMQRFLNVVTGATSLHAARSGSLRQPGLALPSAIPQLFRNDSARSTHARRERLVIVGNGMVGQRFCETLVKLGGHQRFQVVVLGEESTPAYDRVHLTDIWHGRDPSALVLRSKEWYRDHDIELRLGERVALLDRASRTLTTQRGSVFGYDRLVLATGSRVPSLSIDVDSGVELLSYRTLEDAKRILGKVETAGEQSVVVIGAGLLGLEAARALQRLGCQVTVLEASSQVLPRQLDATAALVLEKLLLDAGLRIRTRARIQGVRKDFRGCRVVLGGIDDVFAQVVVATVGARARDEIGREAGLSCDVHGGIRVDGSLCSSDPRVYAVGECAHHPRVPHGLVAPGYAMADTLANCLTGRRRRLSVQQTVTRLKLDLTEVTVLGNPLLAEGGRDWIWQGAGAYRRLVVQQRRIVAALCIGAWHDLTTLQRLLGERRRVSDKLLKRFQESGELGLTRRSEGALGWPDGAVVCNCANVTCGALKRAIAAGHRDVAALGRVSSAGTLCGSCQPHLAALCGAEFQPAVGAAATRSLVVLSGLALCGTLVTLVLPRVPIAQSVRLSGLDVLWVDSLYKQISGFLLVGVLALGLLMSLRKRVKRFQLGAFSSWRLLHAGLGIGALAVAFAHTGFRLGHNLNLALMLAFLTSAASGAISGFTLSDFARRDAVARIARPLRVLHDWLFWPLLMLLGFHVLKVYYF